MSSKQLNSKRKKVTSQHGEDGVIEAIFERIGTTNKWCCEFGAWDGKHLSNTWNLWNNKGWSAVLIEADSERQRRLAESVADKNNVTTLCTMVSSEPPNDLDTIFSKTEMPNEFDLLSIDVDNDDMLIFRALEKYKPRVAIVEVNSYLPPNVEKLATPGYGGRIRKRGSSIKTAVGIAKKMGYELAIHTGNCFFVKREFVEALEIDTENWQELFDDTWVGQKDASFMWLVKNKAQRMLGARAYSGIKSLLYRKRPTVCVYTNGV